MEKKYLIILVLILLVLALFVLFGNKTASTTSNSIIKSLSPNEFKEELEKWDWELIDIRTLWELYETWIIPWATYMNFSDDDFKQKLEKLDKQKKYLIYCNSGNRTGDALIMMKKLWFEEIYDLKWGIQLWMQLWEEVIKYKK